MEDLVSINNLNIEARTRAEGKFRDEIERNGAQHNGACG